MNWDRFFKRYVWDDVKTPLLVRPSRLTRTQADYELLAYAGFLGILFGAVAILTVPPRVPGGGVPLFSIYALTMTCAAVLLHYAKPLLVAKYCATAPVGFLVYIYALRPDVTLHPVDHTGILVLGALWLLYSVRLVLIVRRYPEMSVAVAEPPVPNDDRAG